MVDKMQESSMHVIKEYKVGKMAWDGKLVKACTDKGMLQFIKELDGNIYKVRWHNIEKQTSEDEIVLEDGLRFEAIKESKSKNSVFVLKRNLKPLNIYWIQDRKLVFDKLLTDLNSQIKLLLDKGNAEDYRIKENTDRGSTSNNNNNDNLNNAIKSIIEQVNHDRRRISLSEILTSEIINEIKQDQSLIEELKEQMPPNQRNLQDIYTALSCPQVKYTMRLLDESIYSEQIVTLSTALGLDISFDSLVNKNHMKVFINALDDKYNEGKK